MKMENFQFKARYIANGNKIGAPASSIYTSVVWRESVRIGFTLATLNGLEVKTSDVEIAYLIAPALHDTNTAGASFENHLAYCMLELGYESCMADPDVWLKKFTKPGGTRYYGYILLYVDDAMRTNHGAIYESNKLN